MYQLEKYSGPKSRYTCPNCGKSRVFTRYIDTVSGTYINESFGRCDREISCGYHKKPEKLGQILAHAADLFHPRLKPVSRMQAANLIPYKVFTPSCGSYGSNNLYKFFCERFGQMSTLAVFLKYFMGTSKLWPGATVFWQIDTDARIRTGKIMLYDPLTGKRIKKPYNHISWAHQALKMEGYHLQQCLFGEHLLAEKPHKNKPVAIVESEKSALIASIYLPDFTWLATGGLSNLTPAHCAALKGKKVVLFPDLNAYEAWEQKAIGLRSICHITLSDVLERNASEEQRRSGLDVGDYLLGKG